MGIYFVAGIYGVGKSTLCNKLARKIMIPAFSAGDLISDVVGEKYGANKQVTDKLLNQKILINCINKQLELSKEIIIAGHFCILDNNGRPDELPLEEFREMAISKIILLEANPQIIVEHLAKRDCKDYSIGHIIAMAKVEREKAIEVSKDLDVPLKIHKMQFTENDSVIISDFIRS